MQCNVLLYFILVFTVFQRTRLGLPVKALNTAELELLNIEHYIKLLTGKFIHNVISVQQIHVFDSCDISSTDLRDQAQTI